ncbi:hypothetical protein [Pedobacter nyackensis]|uniref:hypothetical protein n=1 Tax=Pedobacter nyackensis TaxID=475255 RepID=UPI00292D1175|nr:hypothetical protein [Pedobacter nyackensis]
MGHQPKKNSVIEKDVVLDHALDFDFLRAKGIELIQKYAGKNWSDFNLHDPGVTILEYICYGLTDVAYRTTFPIHDILADKKGLINREKNFFVPKELALSSGPVTVSDYRKLLIDSIPEVENIWIEPIKSRFSSSYSKGSYRVIIKPAAAFTEQFEGSPETAGIEHVDQLSQKVKTLLMTHRNIGDNYECFKVLKSFSVYLKADIVIEKNVSPTQVLTEIYNALEKTISPAVTYYTENELLGKGYAIEDIYTGPLLQNGILPDTELHKRLTALDPFDLIKAISSINGVVIIKDLKLSSDGINYQTGIVNFDDEYFPVLRMDDLHPDITLYHDTYNLYIRRLEVLKNEQKIKRQLLSSSVPKRTTPILEGEYKNLKDYVSIQTLFPAIYGIGEEGSFSETPASIAKSRQLKAYLMLFEQLMVNSLAQLSHISDLFSTDTSLASTYFFQPLYLVPNAKYILKAYTNKGYSSSAVNWENFKNDPDQKFTAEISRFIETDEQYKDRKKRALDHILSRFNIAVHKHPVFLYEYYYDQNNHVQRNDLEIKWKSAILNNLTTFTSNRVKGDNYLTPVKDEGLRSGFGRKMALLLHIRNSRRFKLSKAVEKHKNQITLTESEKYHDQVEKESTIDWRGEELNILISPDKNEIETIDPNLLSSNLTFKRQSERLFKSAIEFKNYRIVPYPSEQSKTAAILFKHPQEIKDQKSDKWSIISKHKDEYEALIALKKTIHFFKELSMESEGFYIVEHLLLKPAFESEQYGFTFSGQCGKVLIEQLDWHSFFKRENIISELLSLSRNYKTSHYSETVDKLKELCNFRQPLTKEIVEYLLYNLRLFDLNDINFFPSFNYRIKQLDGQEIAEDFYNFRMTVVFPSWPARFQDESFRKLAKQLFIEECPAHIKISFLWLSLSQMTVFDSIYFDWLEGSTPLSSQKISDFIINHAQKEADVESSGQL